MRVVIDGQGVLSSGIRIFHADYWVVQGFELTGIKGPGLLAEAANRLVARYNVAHDNTAVGILALGSDDVLLEYNEVYNNSLGIKVGSETLPPAGEVRSIRVALCYNLSHDHVLGGEGADGIVVNGGDDAVLEYNLAWMNDDDGIDNSSGGGGGDYATGQTIRYNAVWRSGKAGPAARPWNGIKVSTNSGGNHVIHHNIVFDNQRAGFDCDQEGDWGPNRFYNNTVYGNDVFGVALDMAGVTSERSAATLMNNLLV